MSLKLLVISDRLQSEDCTVGYNCWCGGYKESEALIPDPCILPISLTLKSRPALVMSLKDHGSVNKSPWILPVPFPEQDCGETDWLTITLPRMSFDSSRRQRRLKTNIPLPLVMDLLLHAPHLVYSKASSMHLHRRNNNKMSNQIIFSRTRLLLFYNSGKFIASDLLQLLLLLSGWWSDGGL